jgi:hypothetical protein
MNKWKDYDNFNKQTSTSAGFCDILLIVFIVLKLCHVIDWSWWWVLAPFWIPLLIVIIAIVILVLLERIWK